MNPLARGATPLDLRLVPGALGTWAVCLLAVSTPYAGYAVAGVGALGVAAIGWPRRRAEHRNAWRGWASLTVALGCAVTVAAGGTAIAHVAHRGHVNHAVLRFAEPETRFDVRLTSEVSAGAGEPGARGLLTEARNRASTGASNRAKSRAGGGAQAGPGGKILAVRAPIYLAGVHPSHRVGERVIVTGRVFEGEERRLVMMVGGAHGSSPPRGLLRGVDRLREGVRSSTDQLPPQARGLIAGVAIGDDRELPAHVREAMRATSLTHVTAVSGAHVAVVLGTALFLLARSPRWVRSLLAALILAAMVAVVLPSPSVLRATGMGSAVLIALVSRRPRLAIPLLSVTVIVLLAFDPWLATSIGFGLSVSATTGIVVWGEPISRILGGSTLARAAAVPIAAQAWSAPLLLTFDASIATYAIPANLLAIPALAPATILGLLSALMSLAAPSLAAMIAALASYFTGWIAAVALFFASLPGSMLPWPGGVAGALTLSAVTLIVAAGVWRRTGARRTWQA